MLQTDANSRQHTAARNLLLGAELTSLLRRANAQGVDCVPLRGVALGEQLYGDWLRRPTGDVDVLVRRKQLPEVRRIFYGLGYREVEPRAGFADAFEYTLEYFKDEPIDLVAEPHWTIAYPPFADKIDMEGVWRRTRASTVLEIPTRVLGNEDLLIHLCLHWLHHQKDAPPLWLAEIDQVARREPIRWPLLEEIAASSGVAALVGSVLGEVAKRFDTPLPAQVLRVAQARQPNHSARIGVWLSRQPQVRGRERLALFVSLPRAGDKARYAASFLFPSTRFIREHYGVSSWRATAWTYLRRTCGLLRDAVTGLLKLWLG